MQNVDPNSFEREVAMLLDGKDTGNFGNLMFRDIMTMSIAISLKRIADLLEGGNAVVRLRTDQKT
jgi:hypothetical protein